MTLSQFITARTNKKIDFDGGNGSQCVDTLKDHSYSVLGVALPQFGGSAVSGWHNIKNTYHPDYWTKIKNTPTNFPTEGDHIFFAPTDNNIYGHCAVVISANIQNVVVFEQNGGIGKYLGTGGRQKTYDYTGQKIGKVLGWYSFKK